MASGAVLPGVVVAVVFLGFTALGLRSFRRRQRIVLTPTGVVGETVGLGQLAVPWDAIRRVLATELETRGGHEPFVGIDVDDAHTLKTGRLSRMLMRANVALGFPELNFPVRTLAADPLLLYHALRHYRAHPEHRAELGTQVGLARVRQRDFA